MSAKKKPVKADAIKRVIGLVIFCGGIGMLFGILFAGWNLIISVVMILVGGYLLFLSGQ